MSAELICSSRAKATRDFDSMNDSLASSIGIAQNLRIVSPKSGPNICVLPLVSAIIATYNYGQYLSHALDSILAQEGLGQQFDIEIIVVDDASTDTTPEVVQRYPQVRYLRLQHRQGVSAARNAGIHSSTGKYISFLDADDTWLPQKLRLQLPPLLKDPEVAVVYSQGIRRGPGEERLFPDDSQAPSGHVFEALLVNPFAVHGGCLLIRREAFEKAGYFDESLATTEDFDLSLRLAFHFQFEFQPGPVMIYNISPHGLWLTSVANGGASRDHGRVIEKALRMLPDSPGYNTMREEAPISDRSACDGSVHAHWRPSGGAGEIVRSATSISFEPSLPLGQA